MGSHRWRVSLRPPSLEERSGVRARDTLSQVNEERDQDEPRVVAGYELVSLLGKGGMATVHLARKVGDEGFVALKSLRPDELEDEAATLTLHDEARVLAHVRHVNVVPLLDVLREGGRLLLVMPFVRGASVAELMVFSSRAELPLSKGVASAIVQDILAGLGAAHHAVGANGQPLHVVHRDVSPQNAIIGDDGVTRVLDFGIAKAVGKSTKTTRDGAMKGKIAYMAPEQVHGEDVDFRADLYAAGVLLWELLALDRLFAGANDADTLRRVLMADVPSLATYRDDLPVGGDPFFAKALARSKAARFSSANEMGRELERWIPRASAGEVARALGVCMGEIARRDPPPRSERPPSTVPVTSARPPASSETSIGSSGPRARTWALALAAILGVGAIATGAVVATRTRAPVEVSATKPASAPPSSAKAPEEAHETETPEVPQTPALPREGVKSPNRSLYSSPAPKKQVSTALPPSCAVPYTVDEHGRKKYRTECLP